MWNDESIVKYDKLVFELAENIIKYMLPLEHDVIFDATNLTIEKRMKYIHMAKALGANVTVHWVNCPINIAISRNARRDRKVPIPVITALHKLLQPPTILEGMDKIIIYRQDISVSHEMTPSLDDKSPHG